jgi:hypothetical protein
MYLTWRPENDRGDWHSFLWPLLPHPIFSLLISFRLLSWSQSLYLLMAEHNFINCFTPVLTLSSELWETCLHIRLSLSFPLVCCVIFLSCSRICVNVCSTVGFLPLWRSMKNIISYHLCHKHRLPYSHLEANKEKQERFKTYSHFSAYFAITGDDDDPSFLAVFEYRLVMPLVSTAERKCFSSWFFC